MTLLTDPTLVDLLKDIIKNTLFTKQVISIARCLARSLYLRLRLFFLSIYTHNYNIENKLKKSPQYHDRPTGGYSPHFGTTAKNMLTYQKLVLNLFFFYYIIPVFSNKFNAEFSRKLIKRLKISNCNHSQKKCQRKFPFPQIYELIIGHFNTPASFFPNKPASMLFSFYFL